MVRSLLFSRQIRRRQRLSHAFALSLLAFATVSFRMNPVSPANQAIELFNNGQDEHGKGNFAKAIELYEQAIKLLPEFAEAEYQKGNAYLSIG